MCQNHLLRPKRLVKQEIKQMETIGYRKKIQFHLLGAAFHLLTLDIFHYTETYNTELDSQ